MHSVPGENFKELLWRKITIILNILIDKVSREVVVIVKNY